MGERCAHRGAGAPFYAPPPRRKTSAEIISEARAAIYGDASASSSAGSSGAGAGGALRALRTRRPFTPREQQRTLFTDRARHRDPRPPSAFDLKYLSLSENDEKTLTEIQNGHQQSNLDGAVMLTESQGNVRKKTTLRKQSRSIPENFEEAWGGFPRLPHLSGRSKPLHRRNVTGHVSVDVKLTDSKEILDLAHAISITRPLEGCDGDSSACNGYGYENRTNKSPSPEVGSKKKQFTISKSVSYESSTGLGDIAVRHIDVQLPNTSVTKVNESMSTLELAEALSNRNVDVEKTVLLMDVLQKVVEQDGPSGSLRDMVLRSLYMHIDREDERVLVAIARNMFTMRVTGAHLAAVCKLVFKIARNDKNDHYFKNTNLLELLVEGCGRADPVSEGECCVYGAGALRFLALEPRLRALAHRAGALHLAALHLKILNNAKAENPRAVSEQSTHALYQLTGALRNLAGAGAGVGEGVGEGEASEFVASGALAELVDALVHHTDRDVLTNVARCLSVLSAEQSCCAWLCASRRAAGALVRALAATAARAPLAVRLAYTLGNMAAADEGARNNIYNEEGAVDVLLTILESYAKRNDHDQRDPDSDPDLHLVGTDLGGSDGSNEDVLIKTVRVIANLCLAGRAGRGLASAHAPRSMRALLACLEVAGRSGDDVSLYYENTPESVQSERTTSRERREELATAALATLNNITFFREPPDPPDETDELLDQLCAVTCRWLSGAGAGAGAGAGEAAREAVRALGNVSRGAHAARTLLLHGVVDALDPYLHHEEAPVRCAAAGVLVNVCGAGPAGVAGTVGVSGVSGVPGVSEAAGAAARALVSAATARDPAAAALLARALWNAHAHAPLPPEHAHRAALALAVFIDDESIFAACEASRGGERRASDTELSNHHVKFELDNNNCDADGEIDRDCAHTRPFQKAYSIDEELHLECRSGDDLDTTGCSGEDLGFEEGCFEECDCEPCRRLTAWEELVGVAIPLLEKLRPHKSDASVGTD